jgi:hypothetical protein
MDQPKVIVIGAAGEMARAGIERLSAHLGERSLELYDLSLSRLEQLATTLGPRRVRVGVLDLFDDEALKRTIRGASLIILGAGPYIRTAAPVMRACIETGVDYLDFDDDVESTREALQLDSEAQAAGVALLIGCGASPGMSNVMAVEAAAQLDEVESIDVCFVTGDEGPRAYGAAVIEHMLHISAGECLTWRDGRQVSVEAASASEVYSFGGSIGDFRVYEVAHPEAVTLPRRFPGARSVRVLGGLHPQPGNGVWQGIARAVGLGQMTTPEAVAWLQEVGQDRLGSAKGWRYALSGMLGQVRRGESSLAALASYLWAGVRQQHPSYRGCLLVRVTGTRAGQPTTITLRTGTGGPGTYLGTSMSAITGSCLAAFATLALDQKGELRGTLMPEDWVKPHEFYARLEQLGAPRDEIIAAREVIVPDGARTAASHRA